MMKNKIIKQKSFNFMISEFLRKELNDVAIKSIDFDKTSSGERITINTSTPGLVIGRQGATIKKLTNSIKNKFNLENPQIKIGEVKEPYLSASIVAKMIANNLARFGLKKFKLTSFKSIMGVMGAGAMGVEIRITGKIPSSRSKSWLFNKGYLKKTGYVSDFLVDKAVESVTLKTGVVGIKVQIMLPNTPLPDKIKYLENLEEKEKSVEEKVIEEKENDIKSESKAVSKIEEKEE